MYWKKSIENRNIIIYKSFVPFEMMYQIQFEKVVPQYIQMLAAQACEDYPKCTETIGNLYNDSIGKFREILLGDNSLTKEERIRAYMQEYQKTCTELFKYIIL